MYSVLGFSPNNPVAQRSCMYALFYLVSLLATAASLHQHDCRYGSVPPPYQWHFPTSATPFSLSQDFSSSPQIYRLPADRGVFLALVVDAGNIPRCFL